MRTLSWALHLVRYGSTFSACEKRGNVAFSPACRIIVLSSTFSCGSRALALVKVFNFLIIKKKNIRANIINNLISSTVYRVTFLSNKAPLVVWWLCYHVPLQYIKLWCITNTYITTVSCDVYQYISQSISLDLYIASCISIFSNLFFLYIRVTNIHTFFCNPILHFAQLFQSNRFNSDTYDIQYLHIIF